MATFSNIGLAEPSTITKVVASVTISRGSTVEHQEILVIGGANSSLAVAPVLAAPPVSTEFGVAVRIVSGPSSAADLPVQISGNSTVFQGTSPWVTSGNSTVVQGTSPWVISGNSTVIQGTSPWVISGNSTVIQGTSPWVVSPVSTAYVKNMGLSVDSSNVLNVKIDGSTRVNIGSTAADNVVTIGAVSGGRMNIGSTAADNAVMVSGNSTVVIVSGNSSVIITSGNSSVIITSVVGNRINIGSTAADNVVTIGAWTGGRMNIGSTAADNAVAISGNSTVFQGTSPWVTADVMNSSVMASSASSGVIVRQIVDNILTTASSNAMSASTGFSIQSSAAGIRSYVVAYTLTSTFQTPTTYAFKSGSTLIWPIALAALSSAVSGVNLAVNAPAYLFRTKTAGPLSLVTPSTLAGVRFACSYFRAP